MIINENNINYFVAFGMGFADSTSFKNKMNVFKVSMFTPKDESSEESKLKIDYYEYGYAAGKELMENTIKDMASRN
jgi:hypothetical protein